MHVGLGVFFQGLEPGRSDHDVVRGNLALADQAEPLGFESIWTAEHHFTRYHMMPNPAQFLTYMAGRTRHAKLGTMVMVLPWHDPVRVAEEIAWLDSVSRGRVLLGLGRGLGAVEFDGFRQAMGESRQRFVEYASAIVDALEHGAIEHDGELYQQPRGGVASARRSPHFEGGRTPRPSPRSRPGSLRLWDADCCSSRRSRGRRR